MKKKKKLLAKISDRNLTIVAFSVMFIFLFSSIITIHIKQPNFWGTIPWKESFKNIFLLVIFGSVIHKVLGVISAIVLKEKGGPK